MGRKSRSKEHKKVWVRKAPDEVVSHGPMRIERYGRYVRFHNVSTPEEHAAFLKQSKEANKQVLADLEKKVELLQALVQRYDPVELMHRAAYMVLPLFAKYRSDNELRRDENFYLPAVEYIQYLIARTEPNTDSKVPTDEEWDGIWAQALQVMQLMQSYLLTRGTLKTPPDEIDELRFMLDSRRLAIRVRRYPLFFADHLRSSLTPYEQQIKEIYCTGAEEIIAGLNKIGEYQQRGVLDRYREVIELEYALTEQLRANGYAVDPGATPEEITRTQAALATDEFKAMHEEMQEKMRLTFTPALFDITDLTSLPKPFLSLLSVKPSESVLKTLTGPAPEREDLSPLSTSVLHYKPFLEVDGKFYTFYHSGFDDHMADIIEADLFNKRPAQLSEMAKRRSDRLESDAKDLLSSIIHPDFEHQNVFYPNPDDAGNLTELDLLLGVDDILLLGEAKAGGFSAAARRGAPKSMAQEFSDLIIEGQRQSERAEKYIKSADEVAFFDETGKTEVLRIRHSRYRKVFRVVITREELGWVGAKIARLSIIDPNLSKSYPWHVSIDDLRIIADLFKDDSLRFVHYLELRLLASAETTLDQHDEIDHIGLYNKINYYHELPIKGLDSLTYDTSYIRDIDHYFMAKVAGESPSVPTQEMPQKMREFIAALRLSSLPHRFEVGSIVLSMDAASRNQLKDGLDTIDEGRKLDRQRTFRMPFTARKFGVSISCATDRNWVEELQRSAVQMEVGKCERWLAVQLADKRPYEVTKIEVIAPGRFTDAELAEARSHLEFKTRGMIAAQKFGRNDRCPCGSGLKFKRCHGMR